MTNNVYMYLEVRLDLNPLPKLFKNSDHDERRDCLVMH